MKPEASIAALADHIVKPAFNIAISGAEATS